MTSHVSVLQVLYGVRGAHALFDHIMAPGVRRMEVKRWRSDNQQDTLPHTALCHACPNAQVVYTIDYWGHGGLMISSTVPHTALCHACPNAQVVYTGSDYYGGRPARRVDQ